MKTKILIDWIAVALVTIFALALAILAAVTITERDENGEIVCTKDYPRSELAKDRNDTYGKYFSCPDYFMTTARCCWRYSIMATLLCFILIGLIYLTMRTSWVDKLCHCRR